jgi:hypothetical protein
MKRVPLGGAAGPAGFALDEPDIAVLDEDGERGPDVVGRLDPCPAS